MRCTMIYSLDFNQNHKSDERKLHDMRYFGRIAIELERHVLISQITRNYLEELPIQTSKLL